MQFELAAICTLRVFTAQFALETIKELETKEAAKGPFSSDKSSPCSVYFTGNITFSFSVILVSLFLSNFFCCFGFFFFQICDISFCYNVEF